MSEKNPITFIKVKTHSSDFKLKMHEQSREQILAKYSFTETKPYKH